MRFYAVVVVRPGYLTAQKQREFRSAGFIPSARGSDSIARRYNHADAMLLECEAERAADVRQRLVSEGYTVRFVGDADEARAWVLARADDWEPKDGPFAKLPAGERVVAHVRHYWPAYAAGAAAAAAAGLALF